MMWDNLSSHLTQNIRDAVAASGHQVLSRPRHSPDFAPVEWCFGDMDGWLRAREGMHTLANYVTSVGSAAAALTVEHIRQYFARAHYYVPGLVFRPYDGGQ